jgi:DNA polymerase-1
MNPERILLIDSNAIIHRAYHAYPPQLSTKDGQPTNAVYGFTIMLLETLQKFKPGYVICLFDTKEKTFRHEQYEAYKAHRKPSDPELVSQFPIVRELVAAFNIPQYELAGYEADDLIGSIANNKEITDDMEKIIVTGDHDILQLVSDSKKIKVYMAGSAFSQSKIYDEAEVRARYNLAPKQIIDYKALLGDTSDNIPGVPGVGKKGAETILQTFGSVDAIYDSLKNDDPRWDEKALARYRAKMEQGKESALMSKELATINVSVKLKLDLADARLSDFDEEELREMFARLQFHSLINKLPQVVQSLRGVTMKDILATDAASGEGEGELSEVAADQTQMSFLDGEIAEETENFDYAGYDFNAIDNTEKAIVLLKELQKEKVVSFDIETDGLDLFKANLLGIGLSAADKKGVYIDLKAIDPKNKEFRQELEKLLIKREGGEGNGQQLIVAHNLKFDLVGVVHYLGLANDDSQKFYQSLSVANYFDTLLASYLLTGGEGRSGLKKLAVSELGENMQSIQTLLKVAGTKDMGAVPVEKVSNYCCHDADITRRLYLIFEKRLKEDKHLDALFHKVEMPVLFVLASMEEVGIEVSTKHLDRLAGKASKLISELEQRIYEKAGQEFNINSPKQVGEILFDKLQLQIKYPDLPNPKKTKTGTFSTDERILANYKAESLVEDILYYRELSKLISTYIMGLSKIVDPKDPVVHTSYNQAVASTGRLSSTEPNLQNIPISSELGSEIRKAFTAGEGRLLLAFDYAQQELRLLAHLSGEDKLIEAFQKGQDIHALTASEILEVPLEQVTKEQRRIGKTVNFGVIYGISPFGLADRLKIPQQSAAAFIKQFFAKYPLINHYFGDLKKQAIEVGEVRTILGRKRDASAMRSGNFRVRAALEREVLNFPLQGGAADIMKLGMIGVAKEISTGELAKYNLKLHLQIHDELILSVPEKTSKPDLNKIAERIKEIMMSTAKLKVPLIADAEIGQNWYELEPLKA